MGDPFNQFTPEAISVAYSKTAFDLFHVMQHMTEAVDRVLAPAGFLVDARVRKDTLPPAPLTPCGSEHQ